MTRTTNYEKLRDPSQRRASWLAFFHACSGASGRRNRQAESGRFREREIKVSMKYLLYLPKDYDQKQSWPLMLFLHGAGERGDNLDVVKMHGPPKLIEAGKRVPLHRRLAPVPQGQMVGADRTQDSAWMRSSKKYKVDQDRIYLTGLSMGGFGTWSLGRLSAATASPPSCRSAAAANPS